MSPCMILEANRVMTWPELDFLTHLPLACTVLLSFKSNLNFLNYLSCIYLQTSTIATGSSMSFAPNFLFSVVTNLNKAAMSLGKAPSICDVCIGRVARGCKKEDEVREVE